MNTSLILLLIAMWMLGHAAASSPGRRERRSRLRMPDSGDAAIHGRHYAAHHPVDGPASSAAADLLAKADGYARAGKPLEARLCRKAAIQIEDKDTPPVAAPTPMSEPKVVAAADAEVSRQSARASVAA